MQFGQWTRRKLITLLGGAAVALIEIAVVVALQAIALLGMIAVIVVLIVTDLVVLEHAFSLSGLDGRREQALVLTVNAIMVVGILIWLWRQRGRLREAEQRHAKDQRQQRKGAAKSSEEDKWWTVLEVSPDATANDIRRSYLWKIQQYHPDHVTGLAPGVRELAEKRSKKLNAAYAEAMRERRVKSMIR
jgi:DnaJ-domain-containing protein 1